MLELLTRTAFARRVGVSPAAITIACKDGRLESRGDKKIDPESKLAIKFFRFHEKAAKAIGDRGRGRPVKNGGADPVSTEELQAVASGKMDIPESETIAGQGKQLEIKIKSVNLAEKQLNYLEKTKMVIPINIIALTIGRISAMLEENFRAFAERNADELFDIAKNSNKQMFAATLEKRIDESMVAALDGVKRDVEKLIRAATSE